ncbi:hypothetical protein KY346_01420 [Candidatus Woesearchaeota archaeon]|nr:hypothetical protein [Candidatus Woesearchaeota archaeon]
MFSRKTLRRIWANDLALGYTRPSSGCTDHSLLPHPYDDNKPEITPPSSQEEGELEKKTNTGSNFVMCMDARPGAKKRAWYESADKQKK